MKTLAFALALTTTLAFSPNAQAGEKLTPQERATGAVSILFYQKHCDTIPAKVKLGLASLLMSKIAKKDSDRAIERITTQVASMGLAEWCETTSKR